ELLSFESVELAGVFDRSRLDEVLDEVDVGIMPSMWEEALGYTGLEMIAKGIPLIANPLGGIVEYAREGETAWLNPSCTGEGMAELMLSLVREPDRVLDMNRRLLAVRDQILVHWAQHVEVIELNY